MQNLHIAFILQRHYPLNDEQTAIFCFRIIADMLEDMEQNSSLPILPIRDLVVFPNVVVPLFVGRQVSINAINNCNQNKLILVTQRDSNVDSPTVEDLFTVGVVCRVVQIVRLSDDGYMVSTEAINRVHIDEWIVTDHMQGTYSNIDTIIPSNVGRLEAHIHSLVKAFEEYANIQPRYPAELLESLIRTQDNVKTVNLIASNLPIKVSHKQAILEEPNLEKQCDMLLEHVESEKYIAELEQRIRSRIKKQVEQTQKEVLREQVNAIQRELSEDEDDFSGIEKKIKELDLSQEARDKAETEFKRLKAMNQLSSEASILRSYLECLTDLPWGKMAKINTNLHKAEEVLDKHHYGLEKTKERIYEFIAMQTRMDKVRGPVLCLFGPPGVGKTSLAKSIAEATGRPFVRIALGGMKDEAEIRGHRRTYIGAMPGKIIQGIRTAKYTNPLILLDEIGNIGKDWRGDPEAALLEVLDPEQNSDFHDHYLEVGYDLSSAIFIATTNQLTLQPALRDRFEVINMPGYTPNEKYQIAARHLVKKQRDVHGLTEAEFQVTDSAIRAIITEYTREAGVRNLDRELANLARKALRKIQIHKENTGDAISISVDSSNLREFAGIPKYSETQVNQADMSGMVAGLGWTEMGGDILYIESVIMVGTGKLLITGQLGDVMQESAKAALSLIRSKASTYGITDKFFKTHDIHVHVPEGAIPKDGPSAGVTIFTSILSSITGRLVRSDVAMTGELNLRGMVTAIGGLKEKSLAAHRAQITTILIPKGNEKDVEEIPTEVKDSLNIILCDSIDQVVANAMRG